MSKWPTTLIYGSPRHPQSQGLIERANQTLKKKLEAWVHHQLQDGNAVHWTDGLAEVVYGINITYSSPIRTTPYRMVYGQDPHPHSPSMVQNSQEPDVVGSTHDDAEGNVSDVSMPNDEENEVISDQGSDHFPDNEPGTCDAEGTISEDCRSGDDSDIQMDAASTIIGENHHDNESGEDGDHQMDAASPITIEDDYTSQPGYDNDTQMDTTGPITIEGTDTEQSSDEASDAYSDWNGFDDQDDNEAQGLILIATHVD